MEINELNIQKNLNATFELLRKVRLDIIKLINNWENTVNIEYIFNLDLDSEVVIIEYTRTVTIFCCIRRALKKRHLLNDNRLEELVRVNSIYKINERR